MNITIYTKPNCPNCESAKRLLDAKGLEYAAVDVIEQPSLLEVLLHFHPDARQMPQCFVNGQRVGGLAGLQAALKQLENAK